MDDTNTKNTTLEANKDTELLHANASMSDGQPVEEIPLTFAEEVLSTNVQTISTGDAGLDQTQLVLHTVGGQGEQNLSGENSAVSGTFVADATTLQNLIATGAVQITDADGRPIQFIALGNEQTGSEQRTSVPNVMTTIASDFSASQTDTQTLDSVEPSDAESRLLAQLRDNPNLDEESMARISLITGPPPPQDLPIDTPAWAVRLRDCQKIGHFYRGWLSSEVELDLVLTLHKQQTHTMWGTRQSPCPSKPATRLMWKSQYVPFDGMPFLNAGSRAIVMECQYGPRRKGSNTRKDEMAPLKSDFKQTCPARIYIKKVKKYLEYQVNMDIDKKKMKAAMDKAFQIIKEKEYEGIVQERYYVQLPTQKAHEFHLQDTQEIKSTPGEEIGAAMKPSRIHPLVSQKIRDFVSMGETRLYAIRKQLRKFVEKEIYDTSDSAPDKHNLQFFPTVNDLQNHIHQAIRDIEAGVLPVNLELVSGDSGQTTGVWQPMVTGSPHAETVTLTLTQKPGQEGHVISNVETNLSDGSTQVSQNLTPDTAKLLAKLHPQMFASLNQQNDDQNVLHLQTNTTDIPHLIDQSLVSVSDQITSSDTTITVNIARPAPKPTLESQGTYTVLQTDTGALLLTKSDVMSNQASGVVTVDASSVLPVLTEGSILQPDGSIVSIVGNIEQGETLSQDPTHPHEFDVQTDIVEADDETAQVSTTEYNMSLDESEDHKPGSMMDSEANDTLEDTVHEEEFISQHSDSNIIIDVASVKTECPDDSADLSL